MSDNIEDIENNPLYRCRVCGLLQLDPPWDEDGQHALFLICNCCGTESGYEDCWLPAIHANRKKWLDSGAKWWRPKFMPEGWNLEEQLSHIPEEFR